MDSLHEHLKPGERLLWSGRPAQGLLLTAQDIYLVPFTFLWCGFALFWTFGVAGGGALTFFTLWGLMFVCIGLYMALGRFAVDAWLRSQTRYAVTDRRVLIVRRGVFHSVRSLDADDLGDIQLRRRWGGRGTITLGWDHGFDWTGRHYWTDMVPSLGSAPRLLCIRDAERVFDLILEASRRG